MIWRKRSRSLLRTLALLEPLNDEFYFNGARTLACPKGFHKAANLIQRLMKQEGLNHEQVLLEYYPNTGGITI